MVRRLGFEMKGRTHHLAGSFLGIKAGTVAGDVIAAAVTVSHPLEVPVTFVVDLLVPAAILMDAGRAKVDRLTLGYAVGHPTAAQASSWFVNGEVLKPGVQGQLLPSDEWNLHFKFHWSP